MYLPQEIKVYLIHEKERWKPESDVESFRLKRKRKYIKKMLAALSRN
jgi:hypothetical protein